MPITNLTRQQKISLLFIAFLIIALIIGIFVVRQRQEIRKKAAIETPLQLILNPQTANLTPGQLIAPIIQIDNTSGSPYPISGVEAVIAIGNQIGILTAGSDCLAPFNGLKSITLNENTNTVTILCAVAADQAPYIIQGLEKKDAIRLSLVGKTTPLGQAQLTFTTTRITQAGAAGSMQAVNLSSGGLTGDYTVANPTPSTTANQPPTCVGGIAIPNVPFVNNKFNITKGTTVTLNAYGIGDPDGNSTVQTVIFRHKKTGLPASEQCPNSTDGSLIGQGQSGVDDSGVPIWTINFNTINVAEGEYYIWANPSDGQMQCSGNPYGTSLNNYCTVGVGCTNCKAVALIQVAGTTPTSAPTPTRIPTPTSPIGGLSPTPTRTPTPTQIPTGQYTLEQHPTQVISMPVSAPNSGYAIYALLKQNGVVVTNQTDFTYQWTIDDSSVASITPFTGCTNGIQPPCPEDHLGITGIKVGVTTIRISVTKISEQRQVASTSFYLTVFNPVNTPPPGCTKKYQGDANCDGRIDLIDYSIWLNHQCIPEAGQVCADLRADFNGDLKVDYTGDRAIWFANFGQ